MASLPIHTSHEPPGIVAPSSYLRRSRGQSHPNPTPLPHVEKSESENAVDRDQRLGLVSSSGKALFLRNDIAKLGMKKSWNICKTNAGYHDVRTGKNKRFPQSAN